MNTATATGSAPLAGPTGEQWISVLRARQALDIGYGALQRLAVLGRIRVRLERGEAPKYCREDVERLARKPD